jgi:hypothetical protein
MNDDICKISFSKPHLQDSSRGAPVIWVWDGRQSGGDTVVGIKTQGFMSWWPFFKSLTERNLIFRNNKKFEQYMI